MKFRLAAAVVAGAILLLASATPATALRSKTIIRVDSKRALGHHKWLYAGRVACAGVVHLVGVRRDGRRIELDWALPSLPGAAWALTATRSGYKREYIEVPKSQSCTGARVQIYPR